MTDWDAIPEVAPKAGSRSPMPQRRGDGASEGRLQVDTQPSVDQFRCSHCGLIFNYRTTLNAHMRVHGEVEAYSCTKCGKKFEWYSGLQEHMLQHSQASGNKAYKCKCGQEFIKYTDLLYHVHPGDLSRAIYDEQMEEELARAEREKKFTVKSTTSRRNYFCQYCTQAFREQRELNTHLLAHRGERSYDNTSQFGRLMQQNFRRIMTEMDMYD